MEPAAADQPQQPQHRAVVSLAPVSGARAIYEDDLKALYDKVSAGLREMLQNRPTDFMSLISALKPIVVAITCVVRDYSNGKDEPLDNPSKQALAMNLLKYALAQLHKDGLIPEDVYGGVTTAIDFLGPAIIDGAVAIMHKAEAIGQDIAKNGCKGCAARNNCSVM